MNSPTSNQFDILNADSCSTSSGIFQKFKNETELLNVILNQLSQDWSKSLTQLSCDELL
jgi:hypothetical protein